MSRTLGRVAAVGVLGVVLLAGRVETSSSKDVLVTPNEPHAYQSPSLAVDPVRPDHLVIAYHEGIDHRTCFLARSEDGGRSWRTTALAGRGARFALGHRDLCWKPMVAYGPDGTLFYAFQNSFLGRPYGHEVLLMASADGGRSWRPPRPAYPQRGVSQNWPALAVDRRTGRVYLAWTNVPRDSETGAHTAVVFTGTLQVSSSTDGGRSFGVPVEPNRLHRESVGAAVIAVGRGERLHLAYTYAAPILIIPLGYALVAGSSEDRGRTFRTTQVTDFQSDPGDPLMPHGGFRALALAAAPASADAYLAWWRRSPDTGMTRISVSRSGDDGATWTPGRIVGIPAGGAAHHQHRPWFAVRPDGRLAMAYYDRDGFEGPQHVYAVRSNDRGASFSPPERLSDVASDSRVGPAGEATGGHPSFGDFLAAAPSPRGLLAAWTDSRRGARLDAKQDIAFDATDAGARALRLTIAPRRARIGVRTRFRFETTVERNSRAPVRGVRIRFAGRARTTDAHGRATMTARVRRPGRRAATARKPGYRGARAWIRFRQ